jgi:uncharacterized protein (TIGR00297 family)
VPPSDGNGNPESLQPLTATLALLAVFCVLTARGQGPPAQLVRDRALAAVPAAILFAAAARLLRGVTNFGAIAGCAIALLLWLAGGWQTFVALLSVFAVTFCATRIGYARKLRLGKAEGRGGRRASQVVANVGVAALLAVIAPPYWAVGALAVFCEATADTVSSEVGQAFGGTPRLVTSFSPAAIGTDGAITLLGTMVGSAAAIIVAVIAVALHITSPTHGAIAAAAGIVGMFLDSLLGATLERRGRMDNDQVNGASTVFAALTTALVLWLTRI